MRDSDWEREIGKEKARERAIGKDTLREIDSEGQMGIIRQIVDHYYFKRHKIPLQPAQFLLFSFKNLCVKNWEKERQREKFGKRLGTRKERERLEDIDRERNCEILKERERERYWWKEIGERERDRERERER